MKTKRINLRVSDAMDALIRKKAKSAGMNLTDYVVLCAIDKEVINLDGLKELSSQVKRLGNNVNQFLILARQGKINFVYLDETARELAKIRELLSDTVQRR